MKRLFILYVAGLSLCLFSGASMANPATLNAKQNQVRIAVMGQEDFHPDRTVPGNVRSLPDDLAARVMEHLAATRRFEVVERTALRHVVREQQFGKGKSITDLDKVIESTVNNLPAVNGWTVAAASSAADYNDRLKEFKNLGTTIGADYIVYAVLEQQRGSTKTTAVPFSDRGRVVVKNQVDARLRLRVIEVAKGRIVGADSLRTRISESVFSGREPTQDEYSMFDHLGKLAAISVLDMVFPPQIVSADPWVVNRGSNEQVEIGDQYRIEREGKEIKDASGIVIGKLRSEVGLAKVTQVQAAFSVVSPVSGNFQLNDLALPQKNQAADGSSVSTQNAVAPGLKKQSAASTGTRPRLAVGLVKARSTATTGVDANKHIPDLTDTLISRLTQTKRFQLIDRQETDQLLDEQLAQAMAENRELPSAMGRLKGADYIVIGSVSSFLVEQVTTRLPGSSRILTNQQGSVDGNMRIVNARTGDVMESKKVSVKLLLDEATSQAHVITKLADAYADQVTVNLMNAIYPIKVAAVVSGVVYINRGTDGGLSVGETLRVVRPGQAIIDPDTGVQLGVAETELGELVLSEVDDARSRAPVGQLTLKTGDLAKRLPASKGQRSGQASASAVSARTGGSADKPDDRALTLAVGKVKINRLANNRRLTDVNSMRITNDLMVKLSQFDEFDIMERSEIDQVIDEKAFTAIAAGKSVIAPLRELQGADYLVYAAIDDFMIRLESTTISYTDEIQERYFGTVEATIRLVDVHTGKVKSAIKIRIDDRLKNTKSDAMATNNLIDKFTTRMATSISDDLAARQKGELVPVGRRAPDSTAREKPAKKVNQPNF